MATYSTREVAKKLGVHFITLHRYILEGKFPAPPVQKVSGVKFRVWKERDVQRVQDLLPKIANGRKTRHQRKQAAIGKQPSAKAKQKTNTTTKTQAGAPVPHGSS